MEFVLVHGTTQSPAGWDRLVGALGARGHRVTLIDLPAGQPEWTVTEAQCHRGRRRALR